MMLQNPVAKLQGTRLWPPASRLNRFRGRFGLGLGRLKFQRGLGAGIHMELEINVFQVPANRGDSQAEPVGDFLVGQSLGKQFHNFLFTGRQIIHLGGCGGGLPKRGDDFARDAPLHRHPAQARFPDGRHQFLGGQCFSK